MKLKGLHNEGNAEYHDLIHTLTIPEVFIKFNSSENGLSNEKAEQLLHDYGFNELKEKEKASAFKIFLRQFSSPLVWLLLVAMFISLLIKEIPDAVIIGLIVLLNALLGFHQEYRAEKLIQLLQKLVSSKAKVLRNHFPVKIDSKYLVPGDILLLETGDKIPADARLIEVHELETQEATLTGESQPVTKIINALPKETILADQKNRVYATTIVSRGRGKAVITATGMNTEVGKIAALIEESAEKLTLLQKKLRSLGNILTLGVLIIAAITFITGILFGNKITTMIITAIALAVAAIPEGLPAIITIALSQGVQKMMHRNALVRRLPSVETLGSVNVICTDKTGTLTHNEMTVTKLWANQKKYQVTGSGYEAKGDFFLEGLGQKLSKLEEIKPLLKIGMFCNNTSFTFKKTKKEVVGDPTEAALLVSAEKAGLKLKELEKKETRIKEIPFTSERKLMTTIYQNEKYKFSYTKGAPEILLEKCDRILLNGSLFKLDRTTKQEILKQNKLFAQQALRVLGFAYNDKFSNTKDVEQRMIFVGLQAMIDPPREGVKKSIQTSLQAGIRVIMITGDHLDTAKAIAQELGIKGEAISGQELDKINLDQNIEHINIFARVNSSHKLKIIQALKKKKNIVAMTGDGVNDAPALKKADIGIAMGLTGTDVAKEASDLILTDDNFASIVNAVEEGRRIFDNIRNCVHYLLSSNIGEVLVIFLAALFGLPLPLTPIQILWINLITDGAPATTLSVDPPEPNLMKRKPRNARENILSREIGFSSLLLGAIIALFTLILFWLYQGTSLLKAQTIAFTSLIIFEIVRLHQIRSKQKLSLFSNRWLILALLVSFLLQIIILYTPLATFFKVVPLALVDWGFILLATIIMLSLNKLINYAFQKS